MPKSKFKAGSKAQRKVCDLCCDQLEEQHEVLVCEGGCNSTVHRYCAGVTREYYAKLITDTEPFTCQYCTLRTYRAMVVQLQSDVENLKSELASMKAAVQARTPERRTENIPTEGASLSYAEATSGGGDKPPQHTTPRGTQPQSRSVSNNKFTIVLYGVNECPPGSPRSTRLESDTNSVVSVFSALDNNIQAHSIKECYRLGKFDPKRNNTKPRPILVHFVRMADISSILAKRRSLKRPYSVKPIMSKEQQKIESILLKERWNLLQSGVSRTQIRIRDSNIYVNKKLHGKVVDSTFMPSNTTNSSPIVTPNNQYQFPTMPVANTILSGADTAEPPPPSQSPAGPRLLMHSSSLSDVTMMVDTDNPSLQSSTTNEPNQ